MDDVIFRCHQNPSHRPQKVTSSTWDTPESIYKHAAHPSQIKHTAQSVPTESFISYLIRTTNSLTPTKSIPISVDPPLPVPVHRLLIHRASSEEEKEAKKKKEPLSSGSINPSQPLADIMVPRHNPCATLQAERYPRAPKIQPGDPETTTLVSALVSSSSHVWSHRRRSSLLSRIRAPLRYTIPHARICLPSTRCQPCYLVFFRCSYPVFRPDARVSFEKSRGQVIE